MAGHSWLRWVGGKARAAEAICAHIPRCTGTYHEPMVGAGSILSYLAEFGKVSSKVAASDANAHLIRGWQGIFDEEDALIERIRVHISMHSEDYFYLVRGMQDTVLEADPIDVAAWLFYLNRACFNGLWRVNQKGRLSVSWGKRSPQSIEVAIRNITRTRRILKKAGVGAGNFEHTDVFDSLRSVEAGDVVYVDPPYVSKYDMYTASRKASEWHGKLALACQKACDTGAAVFISQSKEASPLYVPHLPQCRIVPVKTQTTVSQTAKSRGYVDEHLYIIKAEK